MCTYLTRLTISAAGVVLTGLGMAAAAHAGEDGLSLEETPTHVEETVPVVPEGNKCDIEFTVEDCAVPVDESPKPVFTFDPGLSGDDDSSDPGDKSDDPEDGTTEKPQDGEGEPAAQPADQPADEGAGKPSGGGSNESSSGSSGGTPFEDTADAPAPESEETTVTPVSQESSADEGGNRNVLFGVLAIALGSLGLAIVGFGLGRRPHRAGDR